MYGKRWQYMYIPSGLSKAPVSAFLTDFSSHSLPPELLVEMYVLAALLLLLAGACAQERQGEHTLRGLRLCNMEL